MAIPFVMINLDKPYKLRFDLTAMITFEQLTGRKVADLDDELNINDCAEVLWSMLNREYPDMTKLQVIDLVNEHASNYVNVIALVGSAIRAACGGENDPNAGTLTAIQGQINT